MTDNNGTLDPSLETDSGFFTDYAGTVTDAHFGPWEKSNDKDAMFLWLKMATDSPDRPEHEERLSLGQGWSSDDGGETVSNDRGGVKFHRRFSDYAKWIDRAVPLMKAAGAIEQFVGRGKLPGRVTHQASVWVGTRWQVGEEVETYTRKTGPKAGETGEIHRNIPAEFLGWAGEGGSNGKAKVDLSFVPGDLLEQLSAMARASASKDGFMDKVYTDLPAVREHEGLVGKLASESVYKALKVEV